MQGLFGELKRRNVFRVAVTYLVAAWIVAQVAGLAADAFEAPAWVMQMIIISLVIGFVPAVIFAWVFEITPEGIRRERDLAAGEQATAHTSRKLDIAVIVLLIAAIGLLLGDRFLIRAPAPAPTLAESSREHWQLDSIAVLPFADFSPARDQAWLGEGIAETLLHALAQVEGLRVSARTSSFAYRERDADVATIGQELGVATVLEGSVQRAGERLRVVAQLVRTDTQDHIFSRTFDRDAGDIFAIQDEIAQAVTEALMGRAAPTHTGLARTNVNVYDLYMEGRRLWQNRTSEAVHEAVKLLEQAVELDPDYGPARSELATALLFRHLYGGIDLAAERDAIEHHVRRALELDSDDAQAWATRGLLLDELGIYAEGLSALHRAETLNPNDANFQVWLGNRYFTLGRYDHATRHFERALELDPLNTFVRRRFAETLGVVDRADPRIERIARDTVRLFPDSERAWLALLNLYSNREELDELALAGLEAFAHHRDSVAMPWYIAGAFSGLSDHATSDRWVDMARQIDPETTAWSRFYIKRDPERFLELARNEHEQHGQGVLSNFTFALRLNGELEQAWELLQQHFADLPDRDAEGLATVDDYNLLVEGIWLARRFGTEEDVQSRLEISQRKIQEMRDSGALDDFVIPELVTAAALGNTETALELLPRVGPHYRPYVGFLLQFDPIFVPLADTPEGRSLVEWADEQHRIQLERLHAEGPPELFDPRQLTETAHSN